MAGLHHSDPVLTRHHLGPLYRLGLVADLLGYSQRDHEYVRLALVAIDLARCLETCEVSVVEQPIRAVLAREPMEPATRRLFS